MRQCLATVLMPFDASRAQQVERVLDSMRAHPDGCRPALRRALDGLGMVHFMSISVLSDTAPGSPGTLLVLDAAADGELAPALRSVANALGPELQRLLGAAGLGPQAIDLPAYLAAHECGLGQGWGARTLGLPFFGTPGLSVKRIRREARLVFRIAGMNGLLSSDQPALDKLEQVRTKLWRRGDYKWAFVAEEAPHLDLPARGALGGVVFWIRTVPAIAHQLLWPALYPLIVLGLWFPSAWLIALALAAGLVLRFRQLERRMTPDTSPADAASVAAIMERENLTPQNLLITVSTMQPGWLHRFALRIGFVSVGQLAAREFRPGFLAQLGTVHFARWLLLPGGRKIVFISHYDGSLESYLEDFIQQAYQGVNVIWGNAKGFLPTRWLINGGAQDGDRFRRYVLRQQRPAQFCYSAYPSLTTSRIRTNAFICRGIASAASTDDAEEWLVAFGASGRLLPPKHAARALKPALHAKGPLPPTPKAPVKGIETSDIPTLLFGRRTHLPHATILLIRFGNVANVRPFLSSIKAAVTFGDDRGNVVEAGALAFAATAFGPRGLALAAKDLATFAPAFLNGMSAIGRARALGDTGSNEPSRWYWGGEKPVDAILILYHQTEAGLASQIKPIKRRITEFGHELVDCVALEQLGQGGMTEPFGFADGISQPLLRGINDAAAPPGASVLEPGEIILGYPGTTGYLPLSPSLSASLDKTGQLPIRPDDRCDLGANGSYFVVRQLEQDVESFNRWSVQTSCAVRLGTSSLASTPGCLAPSLIAAKAMGRWQNGSALAQHPASPGFTDRNDFLYGSVDPAGHGCPLGAHIRRANPRDSFEPGSDRQLALANRHRLLRVGRKYQAKQGQKPGLMFMALNADIGRQFEFIQQTWLLGRNFHGLDGETDPLLASGRKRTFHTVHTPNGPLRLPLRQSFVTVRGGEYFFMPGAKALRALIESDPQERDDVTLIRACGARP